MSFSIQTNVSSIIAQDNLRVANDFQAKTINRLTSGYRINTSGDDAAGLAIANKFRSDVAELVQGVRNANDGISVLQIVDGGLNNISKILDRLKTLATQSATDTFTGSRTTLNNEYQALLSEINRQASNIGLSDNGSNNTLIRVFIGGGNTQENAQVQIDLSGSNGRVDTTVLGLANTGVAGGGTALTGNTVRLDNPAVAFLTNSGGTATQTFTLNLYNNGATSVDVTVTGDADGLTGDEVLSQLNSALETYGISASLVGSGANAGQIQFGGAVPFSVSVAASTNAAAGTDVATATSTAVNESDYHHDLASITAVTDDTAAELVTFANSKGTVQVTFDETTGADLASAINAINAQTASLGIYAVKDAAGTGLSIQSSSQFTIVKTQEATTGDIFADGLGGQAVTAPTEGASATASAIIAVQKLTAAIAHIGQVQGKVGTGQNTLQQAINLAQSQISSFTAAESRIRDADIAAEAANLTKAQVLQQASLAALAQANAAPQAVLALLSR